MSTSANLATLPDILRDPSKYSVKVFLDGPAWPDDPEAKWPEVSVRVEVSHTANGTGSSQGEPTFSDEKHPVVTNQDVDKSFASILQKTLTGHLEGKMSEYKAWKFESESDVRKGGLCATRRNAFEQSVETAAAEFAGEMQGTDRPQGHPNISMQLSLRECCATRLVSRQLPMSVTAYGDSRFPLATMLRDGSLGLGIEVNLNPIKFRPKVTSKWTARGDSVDLNSPEVKQQLTLLEPISKAFKKAFVDSYNESLKDTRIKRTIEEIANTALFGAFDFELRSPSGRTSLPFSHLRAKLYFVETGYRGWVTPSFLSKK